VLDVDSLTATPLVTEPLDQQDPDWSPDGEWIVYTTTENGLDHELALVRPNEAGQDPVFILPGVDAYQPAWSGDGEKIAFLRDSDHDTWMELWVADADGRGAFCALGQLMGCAVETESHTEPALGSWDPDGDRIAFSYQWYVMDETWTLDSARAGILDLGEHTITWLSPDDALDMGPDWKYSIPDLYAAFKPLPGQVEPGEHILIEMEVGNDGLFPVEGGEVRFDLPAELIVLEADPDTVTAPGEAVVWQIDGDEPVPAGGYPRLFRVQVEVDINTGPGPLAVAGSALPNPPDGDLSDNADEMVLFVPWRVFLPLLQK
jgi:hypothetical protein